MRGRGSIAETLHQGIDDTAAERRIAVVGPFPPIRSGIARHTEAVARTFEARLGVRLRRWGFRRQFPGWLYPGNSERHPAQNGAASGVTETLDGANPLSWERTVREIAAWSPDLVIVPAWTFAIAPSLGWVSRRLAGKGVETCMIVHNAYDHEAAFWKDRLTSWQLGAAGRFVTHNEALAGELAARFPRRPAQVFPHPTFDDLPPARGRMKRRAGIELLFFGLVRPYKGLDVLLDAMAMVRRRDIALTIAGEFWQGLDETRKRIAGLGREDAIELLPRFVTDDEAAELFHRADAVVMPYRAVSGSGVVATACHYGRAVIASDLPGLSGVVRHDETGWLFEAGNAAELAARIDRLDRDATRRAGEAAAAFSCELSWYRFCDVLEEAP